jgi:hypothetical protein
MMLHPKVLINREIYSSEDNYNRIKPRQTQVHSWSDAKVQYFVLLFKVIVLAMVAYLFMDIVVNKKDRNIGHIKSSRSDIQTALKSITSLSDEFMNA